MNIPISCCQVLVKFVKFNSNIVIFVFGLKRRKKVFESRFDTCRETDLKNFDDKTCQSYKENLTLSRLILNKT